MIMSIIFQKENSIPCLKNRAEIPIEICRVPFIGIPVSGENYPKWKS